MTEGPRPAVALALVGVGGFAGTVLRHLFTVAMPTAALGTLLVNVLGSFGLGLVLSDSSLADHVSLRTRLILATGLLSSFTTYSTFALETTQFEPLWAAGYVGANYALAFQAVVLAQVLARWAS